MDQERIGKVAKLLSSHKMAIGKKKKEKTVQLTMSQARLAKTFGDYLFAYYNKVRM